MSEKKYKYRVLPGRRFGAYNEYGPGNTVELTVAEAEGHADKLALVRGQNVPDVPDDEAPVDQAQHLGTMTVAQLQSLPEWEQVEPPRPTLKAEIVDAILAVREAAA